MEDNHGYFCPPEDPDDYRIDVGNEHELVEDVDPQSLIKFVKFLKRGKAPGPDSMHNEVLRQGTTTSLFRHLHKLFTSSIQLGYIPTAWKIATLRMLLKPDNSLLLQVISLFGMVSVIAVNTNYETIRKGHAEIPPRRNRISK